MGQNFIRSCVVSCNGVSISGGGPTDLRVRFELVSHTLQSPNQGRITITNPSLGTVAAFQQEFAQVTLTAGYKRGSVGQIFSGSVVDSMYGVMENITDRLLQIDIADSDIAINQAKVSTTLAAGSTPQDIVNTCLQALGQFGVTLGQIAGVDLSQPVFPRAYPLSGMVRDCLREVALSKNATHSINAGQLNIIGKNATTSSDAIAVNSKTGMIGQAIQSIAGVIVTMLINPGVTVNSNIQLDPSTVISPIFSGTVPLQTDAQDQVKEFSNQLNSSGLYRVLKIEHIGDSRDGPWYQTLTCLGVGQNLNNTQLGLGYQ